MTTTAAVRVYDFIVLFYKFLQLLFVHCAIPLLETQYQSEHFSWLALYSLCKEIYRPSLKLHAMRVIRITEYV